MTVFGVLAATGIIGKVVEGSSQDKAQAGLKTFAQISDSQAVQPLARQQVEQQSRGASNFPRSAWSIRHTPRRLCNAM